MDLSCSLRRGKSRPRRPSLAVSRGPAVRLCAGTLCAGYATATSRTPLDQWGERVAERAPRRGTQWHMARLLRPCERWKAEHCCCCCRCGRALVWTGVTTRRAHWKAALKRLFALNRLLYKTRESEKST